MTRGTRRVMVAAGAGLVLGGAVATPAPAQQTVETTITYAAESASAGIHLAITPPGEAEPAAAITGAGVEGSITSDGPAAAGQADALAVLGESPVHASTSAPPDETDSASSPIPPIDIPGVATIGVLQGEATSASEAEDGLPSTENASTFSGVSIDVAGVDLGPLGTVGADVTVAEATTAADAAAAAETDVAASASSSGVIIEADLDIDALEQLCESLPAGPLQDACDSLADQGAPAVVNVALGVSEVSCGWDGDTADCDGSAAAAVIDILGQTVEVAPGETVTIPEDGPFLVRVSLGDFSKETGSNPDTASGIATGISVELLGQDPALPGLITLQLGQSTAAVSGDVEEVAVIPRTGAPVLPVLLGGSALVAGGLSLRRFLKRR